jgi:hypothetical protein
LLNLEHEFELFGSKYTEKSLESVQLIAKRLHFISKKFIRYINKEGIDVLIDFELMTIVSYCKMDNFTDKFTNDPAHNHLYLEPKTLPQDYVFDRLVVCSSRYKAALSMATFKWEVSKFKKDGKYRRGHNLLLQSLYRVDYSQHWNNGNSKFVVELPFTVLDWTIIEKSVNDQTFDINVIDKLQII